MAELDLRDPDAEAVSLKQALESRYLAYALSTITNRALPDARDGLKPVHRRLLYAMRQLKLDPDSGFKKSARVVGDVIGRFHPHGDQAVYDALVRLAQDFAVRWPLVDGQGNFGNVDGDNAAAMRYTETRLTEVARRLLLDIDAETVGFRETYDGEESEPIVLPAAFPNLLANGASGIAVGMATNIPPHNVVELCDAALHLIGARHARLESLMAHVQGPDFPTGGIMIDDADGLAQAYARGRGAVRLRARYVREDLGRGQWQIVVTEIPYQVQKARLIEKIAELMHMKSLSVLDDIRDESAEDIRLVLVPKSKNIDAEQLMELLFRQTDLETRFAFNMNVLDRHGVPRVMGLRELLLEWLDHRKEVLLNKTAHRLAKIAARLDVLDGYLIVYLNLDAVIAIIREEDKPRPALMARFGLSEIQADAILNMRLRALRKLEEAHIRAEHKELQAEQKGLKKLRGSEDMQWGEIKKELRALKQQFGAKTELGRRRSELGDAPPATEGALDMLAPDEPISVVLSDRGWIRAMKGHIENGDGLNYRDGDKADFVLHARTTDKLLLLASNGRAYTLEAARLPGGRGHGEALRLLIDLQPEEEIVEIFCHQAGRELLVASRSGNGFRVAEDELISTRRAGKQVLNLPKGDALIVCTPAIGDMVAVLGQNRKLLCFALDQLPQMARGKGIRLQRHGDGYLADARVYRKADGLLILDRAGRLQAFRALDDWQGVRAQAGRIRPKGFPSDGRMGAAFPNRL